MHDIDIRKLLPHSGDMCLLDAVVNVDETTICCTASSHHSQDNPLRHNGALSVHVGVEYAAQAVAVHGGWLTHKTSFSVRPRGGMIAVLSDVSWSVVRLDDIADDLDIIAEKIADSAAGVCYRFAVNAVGRCLVSGEIIVALQAQGEMA